MDGLRCWAPLLYGFTAEPWAACESTTLDVITWIQQLNSLLSGIIGL